MINRYLMAPLVILLLHAILPGLLPASSTYSEPEPAELRSIPDTHPKSYLTARDHLTVGDTDEARRLLGRTLREFPHHGPSLTLYLRLLNHSGGTTAVFREVRHQYERNKRADLFEGFLRSFHGETEPFTPLIGWLNERELNPYYSMILARHRLGEGNDTDGIDLLRAALEAFPDNSRLSLLYARALARQGDCRGSLERVNQLIRHRPGWPNPYRLKAALLWSSNRKKARGYLATANHLSGSSTSSASNSVEDVSCSSSDGSFKEHS